MRHEHKSMALLMTVTNDDMIAMSSALEDDDMMIGW